MNDDLKAAINSYLKENLKVEVVNPHYNDQLLPYFPEVKVRLMLEGETLSEDSAPFNHQHAEMT